MRYLVTIADEVLEVEVDGERVLLDGVPVSARLLPRGEGGVRSLRLGTRSISLVPGVRNGAERALFLDGEGFRVEVVDERTHRLREMRRAVGGPAGPRPLTAPMPGLVVKVEVEEGQAVTAGQGVIIVEAMKMENELRAAADGVVVRILVAPGQAVEKDQVLVDFAAPGGESGPDGAAALEGEGGRV
ncbi:MAG: biotin/lipoyl-containing protein [Longimicrobiales bacterium]|nr:biotin/lipoyl-containing protein [Longimicrobiales bacterium]